MRNNIFNFFKYTICLPIILVITVAISVIIPMAIIQSLFSYDTDIVDNFIDMLISIWKPRI
jgi:low affinity Fe/Cu permease